MISLKPNAVQWSLIGPATVAFGAASIFGTTGFGLAVIAGLLANPAMFLALSKKSQRPLWKKIGIASAVTGAGFFASGFAALAGYETIYKAINPSAYQAASQANQKRSDEEARAKKKELQSIGTKSKSEPKRSREDTVCQNSEGKYFGIIAGNSCESDSKLVTSAPDAGFLGMNKGSVESYNSAIEESRKKTKEEKERLQEEAKQRKADLTKWGPFFADSGVRQQAIKACNDYAFRMTGQSRSWFYDDRTNFDIRVIGNRVWVGGPMTVKVKEGNIDGSDRSYQRGVDCYWDKSATSLESGQITVE